MKALSPFGWTMLIIGLLLFGLIFGLTSLPTYKGAPSIFMLLPLLALYFFIGTIGSLYHAAASWKTVKALSLLPLAITLAFTWMTLSIPRKVFPPRNVVFFEEHFSEYEELIEAFRRDRSDSRSTSDVTLPAGFRHLSDNEKIRVNSKGGKTEYYFLYEDGFGEHRGVLYAPSGPIVTWGEYRPMKGHPDWYYADYH